jgi:hypothetical protein
MTIFKLLQLAGHRRSLMLVVVVIKLDGSSQKAHKPSTSNRINSGDSTRTRFILPFCAAFVGWVRFISAIAEINRNPTKYG